MTAAQIAFPPERDEDAPYEMANLYPRTTGLPMTIWTSPRGGARHDARLKVCTRHGDRMEVDNLAVVAIRPRPRLLHGELSSDDLAAVVSWIEKNRIALIDFWEGRSDVTEFARALERL